MKILIFPHHLELGGSQVNAIEMASAVRERYGHDMVVFATPGPALDLVRDHGLPFIAAPRPRGHPSPTMMMALRRVARSQRVDLVHAWDWPQCLDAFYGIHLVGGLPLVGSNMSMTVTRFLPRSIPLTYGTPSLVEAARRVRRGTVMLLEPPVDTVHNAPDVVDGRAFRHRIGLDDRHRLVVIVSRLVSWMKLEGIVRSMDAMIRLAPEVPARLVVVGGGPALDRLTGRAEEVNRQAGCEVVTLAGPMTDPRQAYAAADVVMGMGGSILRGMAFAKPCIVLGEENFSETVTPDSCQRFLWSGFFGVGDGDHRPSRLESQLGSLLADHEVRRRLGAFSRQLVEDRFGLQRGAATLDALYQCGLNQPASPIGTAVDAVRTAGLRMAGRAVPEGIKRSVIRGGELRR